MILERTKAKLAQERENKKQPKKRLGNRQTGMVIVNLLY